MARRNDQGKAETIAILCAGAALLLAIGVWLSDQSAAPGPADFAAAPASQAAAISFEGVQEVLEDAGSQLAAAWESQQKSYDGYPSPLVCYSERSTEWPRAHNPLVPPSCDSYGVNGVIVPLYIKGGVFSATAGGWTQSRLLKSVAAQKLVKTYGAYQGKPAVGRQSTTLGCEYTYVYKNCQDERGFSCTVDDFAENPQGTCQCQRVGKTTWSNTGPSGAGCYVSADTIVQPYWTFDTSTLAGRSITIDQGDTVRLEWACQPRQTIQSHYCYKKTSFGLFCTNINPFSFTVPYSSNATGSGGQFAGTKSVRGAQTVSPQTTTTYSLACGAYPSKPAIYTAGEEGYGKASMNAFSITKPAPLTLTVAVRQTPASPPPTVTITASPNPVVVGKPVTIRATFKAGSGDKLVHAAINDNKQEALTSWTPAGTKTYTFTPTKPGSYVFYPAVHTDKHPSWSSYGKSVTVTAQAAAVQEEEEPTPPTTEDPSEEETEVPIPPPGETCSGAGQVPPTCRCDLGYQGPDGGPCVPIQCAGAHEAGYPSCNCDAANGYVRDLGTNQCILPASVSLLINGGTSARVAKESQITLSWSASNVGANSCVISIAGGPVLLSAASASGSLSQSAAGQTTFVATCLNQAGSAVSAQATLTLIPEIIEQ